MDIVELVARKMARRADIGTSQGWITFYLYLFKYRHTTNDGRFDFYSFREEIAQYAAQLACSAPIIARKVQEANNFVEIERILWRLAEFVYLKYGEKYDKDNIAPHQYDDIAGEASPRTRYIVEKVCGHISWYLCWDDPSLETAKTISSNSIRFDVASVNDINGIQPIPEKVFRAVIQSIMEAENFEKWEFALEEGAAEIWDCINTSTETLFQQLEKRNGTEIERPDYGKEFSDYCQAVEDTVERYSRPRPVIVPDYYDQSEEIGDIEDFFDR